VPEVEFLFFTLSTLEAVKVANRIAASMRLVESIWRPRPDKDDYETTKAFAVKSKWSGAFQTIDNSKGEFSRIDFPREGAAAKALQLVNRNFENAAFAAVIPVFLCDAAWDEVNEPGTPRPGLMKGFTLVRSLPWFTGERAILVFASVADAKVLAHELSHWCGFSHLLFSDDPTNVGHVGGGGFEIDREQLRRYHRWATELTFRKTIAGE
jgi:hypothetical protein